jgi:hypothetical protein
MGQAMSEPNVRDDAPGLWIPHGPAIAQCVVCEKTGAWAVALRSHPASKGMRVRETRRLDECNSLLAHAPASFVVFELTLQNLDALLDWFGRRERMAPCVRAAIVADRSLRAYGPLAIEAGAVCFVTLHRQIAAVASAASRHLEQISAPPCGLAQRVWNSLPWKPRDNSIDNRCTLYDEPEGS